MRNLIAIAGLAMAACTTAELEKERTPRFHETVNAQRFFKGNLHTHTTQSDGDTSPAGVLRWYAKNGYVFVAITDHDKLTTVPEHQIPRDLVVLNGVEITGRAADRKPVHANAICGKSALVGPKEDKSVSEILSSIIDLSRKDGAVTIVNHPNFGWALDGPTLNEADGFEMLEIASGHPLVRDTGGDGHPSAEELWDSYMTKKHRIYGVAVDDAHDYRKFGDAERNPGRAWVQAWAPEPTSQAICEALRQGHFYSAKGNVRISALVVTPTTLELAVDGWDPSTDHVDFIGAGGRMLDRAVSSPARYVLRGGEGYVRAHVFQPRGADHREAWTQAYFVRYE